MSGIRPVQRGDLPRVAELYQRAMRSPDQPAPPGLPAYFERTLLDQPWADPEIPSLVYEDGEGRILGFMGSHVRRVLLDGRPIRMGCGGQLVSDPAQRRLAIGARLLRSYLSGPQELTITDGATETVHEMWLGLGGYAAYPASLVWTRLFRPSRAIGDIWLEHKGRASWRRFIRPAFALVDTPAKRVARPPEGAVGVDADELTPEALMEHQDEVSGQARLRVDYDEAFLKWLWPEMAAVRTRGRLARRLLRRGGRLLGWYVAYLKPGGLSQVMQIAAAKGQLDAVLDQLFFDAWSSGAAALEGRLEPFLYEPIYHRRCLLRHGTWALFHSEDPDAAAAISLGRSALSRLDGEWWMGHHTEPFR